jgi:hypothetical protein
MKPAVCLSLLVSFIPPVFAAGAEVLVSPRIESVSAFKNGVAVIRASFPVDKPGVYVWQRPPIAVHGTFWVESDAKVAVRSTTRMLPVEEGAPVPPPGLQQELEGKSVTVTLKATGAAPAAPLSGRVWSQPKPGPLHLWDTQYASLRGEDSYSRYGYAYSAMRSVYGNAVPPMSAFNGFLILEDERGGRQYIGFDSIASISAQGPFETKKPEMQAAILAFEVAEPQPKPAVVSVTYLAKGLAWVPSYRLDLIGLDKLAIRQSAVIRNELIDLRDAEVRLISGYPNIPFAHVDSPLWANGTLAGFFAQLSSRGGSGRGNGGGTASQQIITSNSMAPDRGGAAVPDVPEEGAAGVDVHFQSIGKRSLAPGDSLSVEVADAKCACEHIVEWVVPDPRDTYGRYRSRDDAAKDDDQPWDAIRFVNPFKFPMTTGGAVTFEGENFRSQSTSYWVNPGQTSTLRTTKALSVRGDASETVKEGQGERVVIAGTHYQRRVADAVLRIENFRKHEVTINVRAQFSGELQSADENPKKRARSERTHAVDQPRELEWNITVPAGGTKALSYSYSFLTQ